MGELLLTVSTRRRIIFVILLAIAIAGVAVYLRQPLEPVYQGRRLSAWLRDFQIRTSKYHESEQDEKAAEAIRQIGTNAIPFLLKDLQSKDTAFEMKLWEFWNKIYFRIPSYIHVPHNFAWFQRERAVYAFEALGQSAEPAIPALREIINSQELIRSGHSEVVRYSLHALLGTDSDRAVPIFINAMTNADIEVRELAIRCLGKLRSKARDAVPALMQALDDASPDVRGPAAYSLGKITLEPKVVVPLLMKRTSDSDARVRGNAVQSLGLFGDDASRALPFLQNAVKDNDEWVRKHAAEAVIRIQCETCDGAIIRGPKGDKKIALLLAGHEFAEGGETILTALATHKAKALFFLTGDFLDNPKFTNLVHQIVEDGHDLGVHSDKHLLYCSWGDSKTTLVSRKKFTRDLYENRYKIWRADDSIDRWSYRFRSKYLLPPYEHYNREIADWTCDHDMTIVNPTAGTLSHADYTGEADTNFVSSQAIFDSIVAKEQQDPNGLNGFLLSFHFGAGASRADKFHTHFGELLDYLTGKGYQFVRIDELLEPKQEKQNE
ncbi:MAG: HEAT repeat domain-containing protein [Verrucomicrobia bacterium]|nr:HEAT repeat domain-containing protein [Verrucomicrobiota bacterium]